MKSEKSIITFIKRYDIFGPEFVRTPVYINIFLLI